MTNGIKISSARQAIAAILLGTALAVAPLVLSACGGQPEDEQVDTGDGQTGKANRDEVGQGGSGSESGSGGSSEDSSGGSVTTSSDSEASHAEDDFYGGSGLYGTDVMQKTNDRSFDGDGIGTWRLEAIMEGDGTILDGNSISSATLELAEDGSGTFTTDTGERHVSWVQYKDFPQLAMATFDDAYVATMELNDAGKLTVKQDVDGDIMLFAKTNSM